MINSLDEAIVAAALEVPGDLLLAGANAVEKLAGWSPTAQTALVAASPAVHYRVHANTIGRAWSQNAEFSGQALAAALRAAAMTARAERAEHKVSLVWTGPESESLSLRSTRSVLHGLVSNAVESLVLVSFASYDVVDLTEALAIVIDRGVAVSAILETPDDPGGPLLIEPAHPFAPIRHDVHFYRWPAETREALFAPSARLHAKCVVADRSRALITSANLTNAGINDNIELGVLIDAGPLPGQLHRHFESLIGVGTLEQVAIPRS